jgi:hypothetical protein
MAKIHSAMAHYMPGMSSKIYEATIDSMQNSGEPAMPGRRDGLYETDSNLSERGSRDRKVLEGSLYQKASMHPLMTAGLLLGGGVAVAALVSQGKKGKEYNGKQRQDRISMQNDSSYRQQPDGRQEFFEYKSGAPG